MKRIRDSLGKWLANTFGPWIELSAGIVSAAVVFGLSRLAQAVSIGTSPLEDRLIGNSHAVNAVVVVLIGIGALLSLSRRSWERHTERRFKQVAQLAESVDLSSRANYRELKEFNEIYQRITNSHFEAVRSSILLEATNRLRPMAMSGESGLLKTSMYVELERAEFDQPVDKAVRTRAVATLFAGDLDPTASVEERQYVEANVSFVQNGADFERIFLVSRDQFDAERDAEIFRLHQGPRPAIPGRLVFKETVAERNPGLLEAIGLGFLLIGTEVGFIDQRETANGGRGYMLTNPRLLEEYQALYDELRVHSLELDAFARSSE